MTRRWSRASLPELWRHRLLAEEDPGLGVPQLRLDEKMNGRLFRYRCMSRLDDALKEHEKKLLEELARAHKKKAELATELLKLDETIANTEMDLAEVSAEVMRRGIAHQKAQHFVIVEGLYD